MLKSPLKAILPINNCSKYLKPLLRFPSNLYSITLPIECPKELINPYKNNLKKYL
jgi:hypothetical protein